MNFEGPTRVIQKAVKLATFFDPDGTRLICRRRWLRVKSASPLRHDDVEVLRHWNRNHFDLQLVVRRIDVQPHLTQKPRHRQHDQRFGRACAQAQMRADTKRRERPWNPVLAARRRIAIGVEREGLGEMLGSR